MEGLLDEILRDVLTRNTFFAATGSSAYDWAVTEFIRVSGSLLPARCFTRIAPELHNASRTSSGVKVRVQLLGSDPTCMADNAHRLAALGPAGIDLNFGCPAPTVNRHRGGAVLLDEPELLYRIAREVSTAVGGRMPFTAKMRLGVEDKSRAVEAAQALVEGGAEMLVVHARTKAEGYKPPAHWPWIARVAEAVPVSVVANGEVWNLEDYRRCQAESGMQDVMVGRGAVADPFLAAHIRNAAAGNESRDLDGEWQALLPVLADFWQAVQRKVEPRHAPGRLKQWLNLLQRTYPQAGQMFQQVRPLRTIAEVDPLLMAAA
ncbi:MAG: tRNA-dihydrouridine synthase family protein [Rhodocyclaceae bacterium]